MALPLPVRNRLAELVLDAFAGGEARATLAALARVDAGGAGRLRPLDAERLVRLGWFRPGPGGEVRLAGAHRRQWPEIRARVVAGLAAVTEAGATEGAPDLAGALARAARLADHGLHFEVHELLEPWWLRADGPVKRALQGLIQVAVGLHHLANGNVAGARALLAEGLARTADTSGVLGLEGAPWRAGLGAVLDALGSGRPPPPVPAWPRPPATSDPCPVPASSDRS